MAAMVPAVDPVAIRWRGLHLIFQPFSSQRDIAIFLEAGYSHFLQPLHRTNGAMTDKVL